jgi:hypothetical protein
MIEKKEPLITLKDAVVLVSIGATAIWLLLHKEWKEGTEAEAKEPKT